MRKAITPKIIGLVLASAAVLFATACTMFRTDEKTGYGKDMAGAFDYRGKLQAHSQDGESHYLMGRVFHERRQYRLAVEEFNMAVEIDPGNASAYNSLGVCRDMLGNYDKAMAAYSAALAIDPDLADARNNLGYSYLLQGRHDEAIESLKKAVALANDNQRYQNNLGLAYARRGDYGAAFIAFSAGGDMAGAHVNIAREYYRNGLFEKAAEHFASTAAMTPHDSPTRDGLAAANSLAQILEAGPVEKNNDASPVQDVSIQATALEDETFFTIPDGALEEQEVAEIDQAVLAEVNLDSVHRNAQSFYAAFVAPIRHLDESGVQTPENGSLKKINEVQAKEMLSAESADAAPSSKPRLKIEVANGNGVRYMARRVGNYLRGKGFIPMYLSNADHFNYKASSIFYSPGYLQDAYRLSKELPGLQSLEEVPVIKDGNAAICIRIGRDLTYHSSLFE
jgi:Flp pilus assembly protein TadD